jgi:hypothetical protein
LLEGLAAKGHEKEHGDRASLLELALSCLELVWILSWACLELVSSLSCARLELVLGLSRVWLEARIDKKECEPTKEFKQAPGGIASVVAKCNKSPTSAAHATIPGGTLRWGRSPCGRLGTMSWHFSTQHACHSAGTRGTMNENMCCRQQIYSSARLRVCQCLNVCALAH